MTTAERLMVEARAAAVVGEAKTAPAKARSARITVVEAARLRGISVTTTLTVRAAIAHPEADVTTGATMMVAATTASAQTIVTTSGVILVTQRQAARVGASLSVIMKVMGAPGMRRRATMFVAGVRDVGVALRARTCAAATL